MINNNPNIKFEELLFTLESIKNNSSNSKEIENFKKLCDYLINDFIKTKIFINHNKKSDNAEFIIRKDKYYTKYIDKLLTIYYSEKTNEMVGVLIKNVSKHLQIADEQNLKGFTIEINTKNYFIGYVFLLNNQIKDFKHNELINHIYKI